MSFIQFLRFDSSTNKVGKVTRKMDVQQIFVELKQWAIDRNQGIGRTVFHNTQIAALGYWENGRLQMMDFHQYDGRQHSEEYFLSNYIYPYWQEGLYYKWFIYTRKMPCGPGQRTRIGTSGNIGGHDCTGQLIFATTGSPATTPEIWVGFELPYAGWPGQSVRGQGATHENMEQSWYHALYARCARGLSQHKTRFWDMRDQKWIAMRGMDIEINPVTLVPQADGRRIEPEYVIDPENYAG